MRPSIVLALVLVALIAGIGGGAVLSNPLLAAAVPANTEPPAREPAPPPQPAPAATPRKLDITTLIDAPLPWGERERVRAARELDDRAILAGEEIRIGVARQDPTVLTVRRPGWGRVEATKFAAQLDFGSLQRAGFEAVLFGEEGSYFGYIVDEIAAGGWDRRSPLSAPGFEKRLEALHKQAAGAGE